MNLAHKIKFFLVPLAILTVMLVPTLQASAQEGQPTGGDPAAVNDAWCNFDLMNTCPLINALILGIPYLLGYLGGLLMTVAAMLTDVFFDINTAILPDNFGVITAGFKVTLSVTNLLFVIALIVIAFATILDSHHHGAQQMLGKLIIAAVLVNFSLLIAGLLLDFSHVLAFPFLSDGDASSGIAASLQPHKFLISPFDLQGEAATAPFVDQGWYRIVLGSLLMVIFTWIMMVVMMAVAVMLVVRYITLVFLIILMPIAWVLPLLPSHELASLGSKWWGKFLHQVFFLPVVAFFVYLATNTADFLKDDFTGISKAFSYNAANAVAEQSLFEGLPQLILQLVVVAGLLIGGLLAASASGGAGADFAKAAAGKIGSFAKDTGKRIGKKAYRYSGAEAGVNKFGARPLSNALAWQGKTRFGRAIGTAMNVATLGQREAIAGKINSLTSVEDDIKKEKEIYDALTPEQRAKQVNSPPITAVGKAGLVASLDGAHQLDAIHGDQAKEFIEALAKVNPGTKVADIKLVKAIVEHDPRAAKYALKQNDDGTPKETAEQAVDRATQNIDKGVASKLDPDVVAGMLKEMGELRFFMSLSNEKLAAIANGSEKNRETLDNGFEELKKTMEGNQTDFSPAQIKRFEQLKNFVKLNPGFQVYNVTSSVDKSEKKNDNPVPPKATPAGGGAAGAGPAPAGGGAAH